MWRVCFPIPWELSGEKTFIANGGMERLPDVLVPEVIERIKTLEKAPDLSELTKLLVTQ